MRKLRLLTAARRNLTEMGQYIAIESGNRDVAKRFTDRLARKLRHLASLPSVPGRSRLELGPDMRSLTVQGYLIVVQYLPDTLQVVAITHGSRDIPAAFAALSHNESDKN